MTWVSFTRAIRHPAFDIATEDRPYAPDFPANIEANGRASNTVRTSAIFSPLTRYHSQTNAVLAGVLVTMSYRTHTSLPSAKIGHNLDVVTFDLHSAGC